MPSEILISSYILRLSVHRNRWRIVLQDVRTGEAEPFSSIEGLIAHLGHLNVRLDWNLAVERRPRAPPDDNGER